MMTINTIKKFNNGVEIPMLGFGVFQAVSGDETINSVKWALEAGYRHLDTATIYENEASVGIGMEESGVAREDIFLTTKLWNEDMRQGREMEAFEKSLKDLRTNYVDLYLVHWPVDCFEKSWKLVEEIYRSGRAKAIGVSNFQIHHLEQLEKVWNIVPAVNQVESHPLLNQNELKTYCESKGIALEAYSPLGSSRGNLLQNETVCVIAEKYKKTPAQIVIRWDLQRGVIVIPKSVHKERIISNKEVFDFELSGDDMSLIDLLNKNHRFMDDPDNFDF
ncbi:MAG: aldo/keto reductase [Anaerocolumna sp.]